MEKEILKKLTIMEASLQASISTCIGEVHEIQKSLLETNINIAKISSQVLEISRRQLNFEVDCFKEKKKLWKAIDEIRKKTTNKSTEAG